MTFNFMESLINFQQLDDKNAKSGTESVIYINTEPLHINIDILDAEDSEKSVHIRRGTTSTEPTCNETGV